MEDITISLPQLGYFILFVIFAVLGVYLILLAKNAYESVKKVNRVLTENEKDIQKTIDNISVISDDVSTITENTKALVEEAGPEIPVIVKDAAFISAYLKGSVKTVEGTVKAIGEGIYETTDAVKESAEDIIGYIKILSEIIKVAVKVFAKK